MKIIKINKLELDSTMSQSRIVFVGGGWLGVWWVAQQNRVTPSPFDF